MSTLLIKIIEFLLPFIADKLIEKLLRLFPRIFSKKKKSSGKISSDTITMRRTKNVLVVAMVGLAASGKSYVAQKLAEKIGANILQMNGDKNTIIDSAFQYLENGMNVILDYDYIDIEERTRLREAFHSLGVKIHFVRAHCNPVTMIYRLIQEQDGTNASELQARIDTVYQDAHLHYTNIKDEISKWKLRKLRFDSFEVDNTDYNTASDSIDNLVTVFKVHGQKKAVV